jgi:ribosomal protein L14E/L6E/L27E
LKDNNVTDIEVGQIVVSTAGRDSGSRMIVMALVDKEYVLLIDGKARPVENPKKKKFKHIKVTEEFSEVVRDKLQKGMSLTNAEVKKIIVSKEGEQVG